MRPTRPSHLEPQKRGRTRRPRPTLGASARPVRRPAVGRQGTRVATRDAPKGTAPALRLVGHTDTLNPTQQPTPPKPVPIHGPTDPRWVLAVRTAESLQGDILPPANREALMRFGKALGLTPFDSCLVLAIVQDQARRGMLAAQAPAAAESQLAMVPLPTPRGMWAELCRHPVRVGLTIASILMLQGMLLWMWMS